MEQRGIVEAGGAALISGAVAAGILLVVAGAIDWPVVVGLAAGGALAAAANYRARTGHAESVAAEAPEVTADNYEAYTQPAAGDGGTEGMETDDPASTDTPDGPDERDYSSH